jgi:hypothetical protein
MLSLNHNCWHGRLSSTTTKGKHSQNCSYEPLQSSYKINVNHNNNNRRQQLFDNVPTTTWVSISWFKSPKRCIKTCKERLWVRHLKLKKKKKNLHVSHYSTGFGYQDIQILRPAPICIQLLMTDFSQLLTPKPDLHPTEYFHVLSVFNRVTAPCSALSLNKS